MNIEASMDMYVVYVSGTYERWGRKI